MEAVVLRTSDRNVFAEPPPTMGVPSTKTSTADFGGIDQQLLLPHMPETRRVEGMCILNNTGASPFERLLYCKVFPSNMSFQVRSTLVSDKSETPCRRCFPLIWR